MPRRVPRRAPPTMGPTKSPKGPTLLSTGVQRGHHEGLARGVASSHTRESPREVPRGIPRGVLRGPSYCQRMPYRVTRALELGGPRRVPKFIQKRLDPPKRATGQGRPPSEKNAEGNRPQAIGNNLHKCITVSHIAMLNVPKHTTHANPGS